MGKGKIFNQIEFKKFKGNGNLALHDIFLSEKKNKNEVES